MRNFNIQKIIMLSLFFGSIIFVTACTTTEKPEVIVWGSTSCPHCVEAIPVFEKDIFDAYGSDIIVTLNALSDTAFETKIPQHTGAEFDFEEYTKTPCAYIPARLVLDASGEVVESSCGGEKTIDDLLVSLEKLF